MDISSEQNIKNHIHEILGGLYKVGTILARNIKDVWWGEMEVDFVFPEYNRTLLPLAHVSANQINEAIMEGSYLVIGLAIKQGKFPVSITFDDFLKHRTVALYRSLNVKYKQQIKSGEIHSLIFKLGDIKNVRWKFSTIEVHFSGFAEWTSKSCLAINEYINTLTE